MMKSILSLSLALLFVCFSSGYAQKKSTRSTAKTKRNKVSQRAPVQKTANAQKNELSELELAKQALEKEAAAAEQAAQTANAQGQTAVAAPAEGESASQEGQVPAGEKTAVQEGESAQQATDGTEAQEGFVVQREALSEAQNLSEEPRVVFNPKNQRDPTLSPDDLLILRHREQMRLAAIEAEKQRKLDEERRKREEAERQRQLELERLKDPTKEVRNRIRVSGVIGQEVFIGSKIYTVGNSIYGARIVEVNPDYVIFSYKGHRFRRNVQL